MLVLNYSICFMNETVKLVFQPAEKGYVGADHMFQDQDGCLDDIDAILSLHVMSLIPTSVIASKLGPMLARIGLFRLKLKE